MEIHTNSKTFQTLLINYQSLVHDSTYTLSVFRDNSKSAIENVVIAIELCQGDEYLDALQILAENKIVAENLAAESKLLADKSNQLCNIAGSALKEATEDSNLTTEKKARLKIFKFESLKLTNTIETIFETFLCAICYLISQPFL